MKKVIVIAKDNGLAASLGPKLDADVVTFPCPEEHSDDTTWASICLAQAVVIPLQGLSEEQVRRLINFAGARGIAAVVAGGSPYALGELPPSVVPVQVAGGELLSDEAVSAIVQAVGIAVEHRKAVEQELASRPPGSGDEPHEPKMGWRTY